MNSGIGHPFRSIGLTVSPGATPYKTRCDHGCCAYVVQRTAFFTSEQVTVRVAEASDERLSLRVTA
jgi:hypothetical protein